MSGNKNNGLGFIAGIILGGLLGAGLGFMSVPENRKKAKDTGEKILNKGKEAFDQFQEEKLEPFIDEVSNKTSKTRTDIEKSFNEAKKDFLSKLEQRGKVQSRKTSTKGRQITSPAKGKPTAS